MKRLLILLLLFIPLLAWADGKILMIIAPKDFRDEELLIPKKAFEEKGFKVEIASKTPKEALGMLGAKVKPDLTLKEVKVEEYKAIVFVGGAGTPVYFDDPEALRIAREAFLKNKVLGAICLAPGILARADVLKGKRATVWPSEEKTLKERGAIYTGKAVEVDGLIVTANGPQAAQDFAKALLELLKK
jgi:protease I